MHILLALLSAAAHASSMASVRMYQTRLQKSVVDFRLFQAMYIFAASVAYFVLSGFRLELDARGWGLALCYGASFYITAMANAACLECGPMSLTSVIVNSSIIMSIAVGCIWYDEVMSATQIIGCVLLAGTFILSGFQPGKGSGAIPMKWYPLVFTAFFMNGVGAVLLNIFGRASDAGAKNSFLAVGYLLAAVSFFLTHLGLMKRRGRANARPDMRPLLIVLVLLAAFGSFIGNGLLMSLNDAMPATILYPLVNGGIAVMASILSCTVFREKLTRQRLLTILMGLGAIVALNL